MKKIELEAIRKMPCKYVTDETVITAVNDIVAILHPDLAPLYYEKGFVKRFKTKKYVKL